MAALSLLALPLSLAALSLLALPLSLAALSLLVLPLLVLPLLALSLTALSLLTTLLVAVLAALSLLVALIVGVVAHLDSLFGYDQFVVLPTCTNSCEKSVTNRQPEIDQDLTSSRATLSPGVYAVHGRNGAPRQPRKCHDTRHSRHPAIRT